MRISKYAQTLFLMLPLGLITGFTAGCSGIGSSSQASVFTMATDAPLPSVVSCELTVNTVTLSNGTSSVSVLSMPEVVDFAKLSGLHQLIDLNAVPVGTYTSATLTLAVPVIGYLNTAGSPATPPTIQTINGTLAQTSVTVPFAQPFVLHANDLVGLRMEFDIAKSLATDNSGQITGAVNPVFHMQLLNATDSNVSIDDFRGGVVGVTGSNSFVMQGPHGRQWNVTTDNSTAMDTGEQVTAFTINGNTIVDVSGQLNPVTHAIEASELAVVSMDKFLLGGLLTNVRPQPQPATAADLYVRTELPDITGIPLGQITTLSLNGSELYKVAHVPLPFTTLLFNNSSLAAGQRVTVGGPINTANGITTLLPHRIVLEPQGQQGTLHTGQTIITSGNNGSFELDDNSTAGVLLPNPLTILTTSQTRFINLSGLSDLAGSTALPLRAVGIILINPATHLPVLVARAVEKLTP